MENLFPLYQRQVLEIDPLLLTDIEFLEFVLHLQESTIERRLRCCKTTTIRFDTLHFNWRVTPTDVSRMDTSVALGHEKIQYPNSRL